mmetsp:Transcript_1959/g.5324  ORF Transcript_1959/g.5324 Transcript_1959/m.5324 type:complete len:227 (-) Transcript_1959:657-1337(-)
MEVADGPFLPASGDPLQHRLRVAPPLPKRGQGVRKEFGRYLRPVLTHRGIRPNHRVQGKRLPHVVALLAGLEGKESARGVPLWCAGVSRLPEQELKSHLLPQFRLLLAARHDVLHLVNLARGVPLDVVQLLEVHAFRGHHEPAGGVHKRGLEDARDVGQYLLVNGVPEVHRRVEGVLTSPQLLHLPLLEQLQKVMPALLAEVQGLVKNGQDLGKRGVGQREKEIAP